MLCQILAQAAGKKGLSTDQIAKKLSKIVAPSVTAQEVQRWLDGSSTLPNDNQLRGLSLILGLDLRELNKALYLETAQWAARYE